MARKQNKKKKERVYWHDTAELEGECVNCVKMSYVATDYRYPRNEMTNWLPISFQNQQVFIVFTYDV